MKAKISVYDGWAHDITIMTHHEIKGRISSFYECIDGKRSRPPEDVGGIRGYERFLDIISDPNHPQYDESLKWAERDTFGRKFDPDYFYKNAANRKIDFYMNFDKDILEKGLRGEVFSFDGDRGCIRTANGFLTLDDVEQLLDRYDNEDKLSIKVKKT